MFGLKYFFSVACGLLFSYSSIAQSEITLEDIYLNNQYNPKSIVELRSMQDGLHYTINEAGASVGQYAYTTGEKTAEIFHVRMTEGVIAKFDSYAFNQDETALLISTQKEERYRRAAFYNNYVFDLKKKTTTLLSESGKQMYAHFAPEGNKVAYVIDNNLYYKDLDINKEVRITDDGKKNFIINGGSDWVYEEEFRLVRAFEWSPDGKKIAYYRFDETDVPEYTLPLYNSNLYPVNYTYKYPKVGEGNSKIEIYIYDLESGNKVKVNTGDAEYIPRIKWIDNKRLSVMLLNRLQNQLYLMAADANTGITTRLLIEESDKYLIVNDDLTFLENNKGFIWRSEADGYSHLYHMDMEGNIVKQITKGEWDVLEFLGFDENENRLYYKAAQISPLYQDIYSVGLDGNNTKRISELPGTNHAVFSKRFNHYILYYSNISTPVTITLHDKTGREIRVLENNTELKEKLARLQISKPEFFSFETSDKILLNGYMINPPDFDAEKKYPVLMFVYGGPNYQHANDGWVVRSGGNYTWFQMLAQKGYIIVAVDGRGSGARGRDFRQVIYQNLGKYETMDQIEVAKWLGSQSYIDAGRIGIFGWSYGGYISALCITKGADVFKTAIAVAPVSNWKFYDNVYTERYMGTMQTNPGGFDANAPTNYTDLLKGNFLLVHGTGDDNVHWQNSAELINALVKSNKQFDLMIYPDRNHSITGGTTKYHLYKKMTDFILENL